MGKANDVLMDHNYDGIQELDNDLPPWWVNLFYFTIVFSFVYLIYYHVYENSPSSADEYNREVALASGIDYDMMGRNNKTPLMGYTSPYYNFEMEMTPKIREKFKSYIGEDVTFERLITEAKSKATEEQLKLFNSDLLAELSKKLPLSENEIIEEKGGGFDREMSLEPLGGKSVYIQNCVSCHGKFGEGLVGPNLTDKFWIHGGTIENIKQTIVVGVPAKGMIPWKGVLKDEEINDVAQYILSLQGTNPSNPKAPEGIPIN